MNFLARGSRFGKATAMRAILALALTAFVAETTGCAKDEGHQASEQAASERRAELAAKYNSKLAEAVGIRDPKTGWLTPDDCDGMLWTGKYAAASHVEGVDIRAAEYPAEAGRFNRRPAPFCEAGAGSASSWSRDMGNGLLLYAWGKGQLDVLQRHAAYGKRQNWKMGQPTADGRTIYTPSMIGRLYTVIYALGGEDSPARAWPTVYTAGLENYEAHMQMIDIWLRSEIEARRSAEHKPSVSDTMLKRVREHAAREPQCPMYQAMLGVFEGDLSHATDLLLQDTYVCEYGRDNQRQILADWVWTADYVLRYLK